jgi:hypothetical protein
LSLAALHRAALSHGDEVVTQPAGRIRHCFSLIIVLAERRGARVAGY